MAVIPIDDRKSRKRTSSSTPHPSSRPSRRSKDRKLWPVDPDTWAPDFDLSYELEENREKYVVDSREAVQLTIYNCPPNCYHGILRLQADNQSESGTGPSINSCIVACCYYGLSILRASDDVERMMSLRQDFSRCNTTTDKNTYHMIAAWFERFDIQTLRGRKIGIRILPSLHDELSRTAAELGISLDALVVLCLLLTLVDQPTTLKAHSHEMQSVLDSFFSQVAIRVRGARALMAEFGLLGRPS